MMQSRQHKVVQHVSRTSIAAATALGFSLFLSGCANVAALHATATAVPAQDSAQPETSSNGTLSFDAETQVVKQDGGTAYFMVTRVNGMTGAVGVSYATGGGTAIPGTDYTAKSGTLSWADGDATVKTIGVPILDKTVSPKVTFHINLTSPTGGASLGTVPEAVVSEEAYYTPPSTLSNFSFANWKLTLPIDEYRDSDNTYGAWTIDQAGGLASGFADAYFYASGTEVVFYDPANGATTTPNSGSDHTRSELRELYTGTGHDSNDDWTSTIGGTMTGTCTVDEVAPLADEATIAQIHGESYVFVLLVYRPATSIVELDTYDANSATSTKTNVTVLSNVALGTTLSYTLKYSGSTITAIVNGTTKTITAGPTWAGTPVYFKAGAYSAAANSGNGDSDATQVTYSALSVSHP